MIQISRSERDALLEAFPSAEIHRTRYKYYLAATDAALGALNGIRGTKASRQHKPQYYRHLDKTAQKRPYWRKDKRREERA